MWYVAEWNNKQPTGTDLQDARRNARLTISEAADLCGLHRTAYRRQERGQSRASLAAYRLLCLIAGWLPGNDWHGWSVRDGQLWTPEGWSVTPGEIRSLPYLYAQIAELKRQLREPAPAAAPVASNVIPFPAGRARQ